MITHFNATCSCTCTWAADERIKRRRERETQIGERGERTYAELSLKAHRGRVSRDDPIAQINISTNTRHDSTPLTTTPQAPRTATRTRPVRRRTSIHISYCKSQHTMLQHTTGRCPDYPLLRAASAACYARRAVFVLISPVPCMHSTSTLHPKLTFSQIPHAHRQFTPPHSNCNSKFPR